MGKCLPGSSPMTAPLLQRMNEMARQPILLVACDFDGTLAPLVNDPRGARAEPEALRALRSLAALPQTYVAVVSGRGLADLRAVVGEQAGLRLLGSHGCET